jgi:hypothetical protein
MSLYQGFPQHSDTSDADFCIDVLNGLIEAEDSKITMESGNGSGTPLQLGLSTGEKLLGTPRHLLISHVIPPHSPS